MNETRKDLPNTREESLCPCKSKKIYSDCCQFYHLRKTKPPTAEKLMRSRYSAFFFRLVDYLVETTHPDKRDKNLHRDLEDTIHYTNWKFLTILSTSKGGKKDKTGKVEFIAEYYWDNQPQELHECSRFKRYKGDWKYLDDKG
ncbi:MAG: SecC motif-containing protein [Akkermansiaceae bacterium]|nr:SecC motif-containing protein [Akkermansiaceae bacterium]